VIIQNSILESYDLLKEKKRKAKIGLPNFVFKELYYGDVVISRWSELEFKSNTKPKKVKEAIDFLTWKWDWKTILIVSFSSLFLYNHYYMYIVKFLDTCIGGSFDKLISRAALDIVFQAADTRLSGVPNLYSMTPHYLDLCMFFDLFI